jgi:hypothetical protein
MGGDPMNILALIAVSAAYIGLGVLRYLVLESRQEHRSKPLSKRQTEALLKAWEDFDLGRNRPEPPRTPVVRPDLWDEWLDGDHTPRLPTRQKNPRGHPRGNLRT